MKRYFFLIIFTVLIVAWLFINKKQQLKFDTIPAKNTISEKKFTNITSTQLFEMLKNKDFYFLNVHTPYEGEIVKTDAFIPFDQLDQNLAKLPQDKSAKIVVYCRSGRMSEEASQKLAELGYTNVSNLLLGMHDWQSKGYPLKLPLPS